MKNLEIPVDETYFASCIEGARAAGLVLLGQATIDSNSCDLRKKSSIYGTEIPVTALLRVTTLFFSLPDRAFLLRTVFNEEIKHDSSKAQKGERVRSSDSNTPYWVFHILMGAQPGKWSGDNSGWIYLPDSFEGDTLSIHVQDSPDKSPANYAMISSAPADEDPEVQDGDYKISLGNYKSEPKPDLFARAIKNLIEGLSPHIRPGKLGRSTGKRLDNFPPWIDFYHCEDSFWSQFPVELLAETIDGPLAIDPRDASLRDLVYGS